MPPRMLHGRAHVMGSLKALATTVVIALLALGVSGADSLCGPYHMHCNSAAVCHKEPTGGHGHALGVLGARHLLALLHCKLPQLSGAEERSSLSSPCAHFRRCKTALSEVPEMIYLLQCALQLIQILRSSHPCF